jgi:hypothetical protein
MALFGAFFTFLLVYMFRFAYYSVVPLAIFTALGIVRVARLAAARLPASAGAVVVAALTLAPCIPLLLPSSWSSQRSRLLATLLTSVRNGSLPKSGGIMARWDNGHHIRHYSGLPVVVSPFGTDGGAGSVEDASAFFLAKDERGAEQLLHKRSIRYVLLADPANAVLESVALLHPAEPPVQVIGDRYRGFTIECKPGYDQLVNARLFFRAGGAGVGNDRALGGFRLVSEVGPTGGPPLFRLFEVVTGAEVKVTGARPGARVTVKLPVKTALGTLVWEDAVLADSSGQARFRLPYASAAVGDVAAGPYLVSDGSGQAQIVLTDRDVEEGRRLQAVLGR